MAKVTITIEDVPGANGRPAVMLGMTTDHAEASDEPRTLGRQFANVWFAFMCAAIDGDMVSLDDLAAIPTTDEPRR